VFAGIRQTNQNVGRSEQESARALYGADKTFRRRRAMLESDLGRGGEMTRGTPADPSRTPRSKSERSRSRTGSRLVIAAFDGGEGGRNALAYASGLAERTAARLGYVLHPAGDQAWLAREGARTIDNRCPVEVLTGAGDPATVIAETSERLRADAIVVGRSRHPYLHLLGSVPARLVRRAGCPVVVIPG
jgi:nucleotide-binding universal stress UspA family protein